MLGFGELGRSPAFGELGFGELGRNPIARPLGLGIGLAIGIVPRYGAIAMG